MTVVLWILKIIGIALLCLLGLLLLLIAVILFVPVRYRIQGELKEKETQIHIRAVWLLHLVSFLGDYAEGAFDYKLKIFGISKKMQDSEEEPSEPEDVAKKKKDSRKQREDSKETDEISQERAAVQSLSIEAEPVAETPPDEEGRAGKKRSETKPEKKAKKRTGRGKIAARIQKIRESWKKIWDFIVHLPQKFDKIKEVVTDAGNKNALALIWRELRYLLRHFKFRKIHTDLEFAAGDPALTGQILGGISVLPAVYRYDVHIYPDFMADSFYVRGTFDIRGRIRLVHLLRSVIRLLKEKDVRKVLSQFQK